MGEIIDLTNTVMCPGKKVKVNFCLLHGTMKSLIVLYSFPLVLAYVGYISRMLSSRALIGRKSAKPKGAWLIFRQKNDSRLNIELIWEFVLL